LPAVQARKGNARAAAHAATRRTLKLIALACPTDEAQLGNVKGMGPMKVKMYGAALLGALYGDAGATEPRVVYDEPPAVGE
jgi:hypothetical protein